MKLVSWNVNSLRSAEKSFLEFIKVEQPDLLMIQELRAEPRDLSMWLLNVPGYKSTFNPSGRPGYGGTAWYYKDVAGLRDVSAKTGIERLDAEGRTITARLNNVSILGSYMPNGSSNEERLQYKLEFYRQATNWVKKQMAAGRSIILGGDLNVAHTEIDLFAPRWNKNRSGFLEIERQWLTELLGLGLVDTFRHFEPGPGHYSWWHFRDPKRVNNEGWRFDYFLVSKNILSRVNSSVIRRDIFGSDHAPIVLDIAL